MAIIEADAQPQTPFEQDIVATIEGPDDPSVTAPGSTAVLSPVSAEHEKQIPCNGRSNCHGVWRNGISRTARCAPSSGSKPAGPDRLADVLEELSEAEQLGIVDTLGRAFLKPLLATILSPSAVPRSSVLASNPVALCA